MSHEDSLDEETKRILTEVDSDDSKESPVSKKEIITKKEGYEEYYLDQNEDPTDEERDKNW